MDTATPMETKTPTPLADNTPQNSMTPPNTRLMSGMSGVTALNFSSEEPSRSICGDSPAILPVNVFKKGRQQPQHPGKAPPQTTSAASSSPPLSGHSHQSTPTFGMLPRFRGELGAIALKLDFTSPSLSVLSPVVDASPPVVQPGDRAPVKKRVSEGGRN